MNTTITLRIKNREEKYLLISKILNFDTCVIKKIHIMDNGLRNNSKFVKEPLSGFITTNEFHRNRSQVEIMS